MEKIVKEQSKLNKNLSIIRKKEEEKKANTPKKKLRVAAYARVSTEDERQESSFDIQVSNYEKTLSENPDWDLVGIYADKGITGTNTRRRPEFNRMIRDAKAGKIDLIIAKSISRFARNTVDMLLYTRELRDIGVGVYFEKERINTLMLSSEMLLTVYASFAQEESRAISENLKTGIRARFKMGIPKYTAILGYNHNREDDSWEIDPEGAKTVRKIYSCFLNEGMTIEEIAMVLQQGRYKKTNKTSKKWYASNVHSILQSEKYIGDCLMQKFYVVDHLTHRKVKNDDCKVEQYYIKDHHPAIVTREQHALALKIYALEKRRKGTGQLPFYEILKCPKCGRNMVKIRAKEEKTGFFWVCPGAANGTKMVDSRPCANYSIFHGSLVDNITRIIGKEFKNDRVLYVYLSEHVDKIVVSKDYKKITVLYKNGKEETYDFIEDEKYQRQALKRTVRNKATEIMVSYEDGLAVVTNHIVEEAKIDEDNED
ncbi:MAG: Transposon Tn3 resolvase [Tenericutes bacterium ADurb.BinA124]|nr:MAG: Transposon Tn3 resolvase [Tenericutes bacterium ADurb.BinA124]